MRTSPPWAITPGPFGTWGADAVIVADLGAVAVIRRAAPELEVHVSTQASCLNAAAARVYADMGVKRIVPGRELSLKRLGALRRELGPSPQLEVFVHGAMCMAYSGRCMMSAFMTGRSANRGGCAQSCRWRYRLEEETRPGQYFPVEEDGRGMTILSSMDLNAMPFLDELVAAGPASLKIEGRMKTAAYVATVTNAYRRRLDALASGMDSPALLKALLRELDSVSHRPYGSGFFFGEMKSAPGELAGTTETCRFAAAVAEDTRDGWTTVVLRNKLRVGDAAEIVSPDSLGARMRIEAIRDGSGLETDEAREPGRRYALFGEAALKAGDLLRLRIERETEAGT